MLSRKVTDQEKLVGEIEAEKKRAEEELRDHVGNLKNARKDLDEIDEEIRALVCTLCPCVEINVYLPINLYAIVIITIFIVQETTIEERKSPLTESKERLVLTETKLKYANESLNKAHQVDEAHRVKMNDLERKLNELDIQMKVYEEVVAEECQNPGRNIQLDDQV